MSDIKKDIEIVKKQVQELDELYDVSRKKKDSLMGSISLFCASIGLTIIGGYLFFPSFSAVPILFSLVVSVPVMLSLTMSIYLGYDLIKECH